MTGNDGTSLSDTYDLVQDQSGFLWFATNVGLYRYDGYTLTDFTHDAGDPNSIAGNFIANLCVGKDGTLWVGLKNGVLSKLLPENGLFKNYSAQPDQAGGLSGEGIKYLYEDLEGFLWIGTDAGVNRFDPRLEHFDTYRTDGAFASGLVGENVVGFGEDKSGRFWTATKKGLHYFDREKDKFSFVEAAGKGLDEPIFTTFYVDDDGYLWSGTKMGDIRKFDPIKMQVAPFPKEKFTQNVICAIFEDRARTFWFATKDGLFHWQPQGDIWEHIVTNPLDNHGLNSNIIWEINQDRSGILWFATQAGVNRHNPATRRFTTYRQDPGDTEGLSNDKVTVFCSDPSGDIWIGTVNGLNRFDPLSGRFQVYQSDPENPNSLKGNAVLSLYRDGRDRIWVGTNIGLSRFARDLNGFVAYPLPGSAAGLRIRAILEDQEGALWVGTEREGLSRMHGLDGSAEHFRFNPDDSHSLSHNQVRSIFQASDGTLWVGTQGGLNRRDPKTGHFIRYLAQGGNSNSLSNNYITTIFEDKDGALWVTTFGGGLNRLSSLRPDPSKPVDAVYTRKDGLPSDSLYGIHQDQNGYLWLGSANGLSRFDPGQQTFKNYDSRDGIPGSGYNLFKGEDGKVYFGDTGLTFFHPQQFVSDRTLPQVVFTDFQIANTSVRPRDLDPGSPLAQPIHLLTEQITLTHRQFPISFEFAALHYAVPSKNLYQYRLDPFDGDWIQTDAHKRFAPYSKLDAGQYALRVRGSNGDGIWSETEASLVLKVMPPLWLTWWAKFLYFIALGGVVAGYMRSQQKKLAYHNSVNERLKQVDRLKDEFLANTSHELRTPLNGIIGLAESLMDGATGKLPRKTVEHLGMVVLSGKRLAHLVNDILDFSQLKSSNLELNTRSIDLVALTDVVLQLSQPLVGKKALTLVNAIGPTEATVEADEDRLQQILYNLIGNAIKFTEKGKVVVAAEKQGDQVVVSVTDTGIGIAEDKLESVFQSFVQSDGSIARTYGGTGLGLTVSKQLVELHQGRIWIESELGKGSTFFFSLPISGGEPEAERVARTPPPLSALSSEPLPLEESDSCQNEAVNQSGFHILVVDDEPINRQVLINHLALHSYRVREASGGAEALSMIEEHPIDLVLLDIMMPGMSGYRVCEELRLKFSVQELPIIFLTARNQVADLITGFEAGANDYLSKPVDKSELLSRVQTHLELLDINRNMEAKVADRTRELSDKNDEILRTQNQLVVQEKMATLGTLTAGIAHEINNPNNFIYAGAQNLEAENIGFKEFLVQLAGEDADEDILGSFEEWFVRLEKHVAPIRRGSERIADIVRDLHLFSRLDQSEKKRVNILDGLGSTINLVRSQYANHVTIELEPGPGLILDCWPAELNQVFLNIILNASESICRKKEENQSEDMGVLKIQGRIVDNEAVVTFIDSGVGIPADNLQKIFEAFYTTKSLGNKGLGLYTSYRIVEKHHGRITAASELGIGATFRLFLPMGN